MKTSPRVRVRARAAFRAREGLGGAFGPEHRDYVVGECVADERADVSWERERRGRENASALERRKCSGDLRHRRQAGRWCGPNKPVRHTCTERDEKGKYPLGNLLGTMRRA